MKLACFAALVLVIPCATAAEPAGSAEFFEKKVRPILVEHCFKCHGDTKGKAPKGGLRLDSRTGMLKGGDNGSVLLPGSPNKSKLIEAIRFQNSELKMPPSGKLTAQHLADLEAWVKDGAIWPNDTAVAVPNTSTFDLAKRKREHWAWQPVRPTMPPDVKNAAWPTDPVDRFILAKLEASGMKPAPAAQRRTWIRRVTFDLIGLPPTPAEIDAFLADSSAEAKRKVVDRLLESPHFGERWGRHWLDLMRYAETRGHEFDAIIPNAYQYRDYMIRALNTDVPYDHLVREHVAGDLIEKPRLHPKEGFNESVLGTGFWFLGEEVHSPVDIRQDQADRFDNRIDVLTKAFVGLTVSCARCHDHKFDAIATKDYYALYGFMESAGYRLVRFDSLDQNRRVAADLDAINERQAKALAASLAKTFEPLAKKMLAYLQAARVLILSGTDIVGTPSGDVVFEDFESGTYANWKVTGAAFGDKPQSLTTIAPYQGKINAIGKYFVNSHNVRPGGDVTKGDALTGTMTSREFTISHRSITFLIGGGSYAGKTCVNLLIDGKVARTAVGPDNNQMVPARWDVRDFKGKTARIQIVDEATGGWGNIGIDEIRFNDREAGKESQNVIRSSDFSDSFKTKLADLAKAKNLDVVALSAMVEETLRASRDRSHPLHLWAKLSTEASKDEDKQLATLIASLQSPKESVPVEVVIDYANNKPHEWLPDEGSFGIRPMRPGQLRVDADGQVRFTDHSAAEYDKAWDVLESAPGTELDHGSLGRRQRAGRSIRTPGFKVTGGKVHYLVSGGGMAYAAIDNHTLVAGPLHGQIVQDIPFSKGLRWITHDLTPYQGHYAHIEFTPGKEGELAIAMVVQSDRAPALPTSAFIPGGNFKNTNELAGAYESELLAALKSGPATAREARLANVLLYLVNERPEIKEVATRFAKERTEALKNIIVRSRLALAMWEGTAFDEQVFIRGSPRGLGERVPRRFLEALSGTAPVSTSPGSGRLELARQITDPVANPFVARVAVNRVWRHLFGRGIVATVDNFGLLGELPTHPELLDHLANRFVRDGWSIKRLIRDLALSSTYGMATQGDTESAKADPQNLLLHRAHLRRLEGEAIRDSMLAVSGRLDRTALGSPIPIHLTPFLEGRGKPATSGPPDGMGRRSIYLGVRRNFLNPMLLAFDTPIPFSTVGRRQVSNVPAQALILMNDPFVHQQASVWAKAALARPGTNEDRVRGMYHEAFGRPATTSEIAACVEFVNEQATRHGVKPDDVKPWSDLAHTLFNTKEFVYLD